MLNASYSFAQLCGSYEERHAHGRAGSSRKRDAVCRKEEDFCGRKKAQKKAEKREVHALIVAPDSMPCAELSV